VHIRKKVTEISRNLLTNAEKYVIIYKNIFCNKSIDIL